MKDFMVLKEMINGIITRRKKNQFVGDHVRVVVTGVGNTVLVIPILRIDQADEKCPAVSVDLIAVLPMNDLLVEHQHIRLINFHAKMAG